MCGLGLGMMVLFLVHMVLVSVTPVRRGTLEALSVRFFVVLGPVDPCLTRWSPSIYLVSAVFKVVLKKPDKMTVS